MATELATPAELAALAQQKLRSLVDPGGTGAVDLSPGSRNDIMVSICVALATRVFQYTADRLTARSLATATGEDLDALVQDVYQDVRKGANAATTTIYLQRVGTAATVVPFGSRFDVPATSTQQGVSFTVSADVPVALNAGVSVPVAVQVQCAQTGTIGNVATSAITAIRDPLPDTSWTVAAVPAGAAAFAAGGSAAESDDDFRARIQRSAFDDSKQRGTRAAIETGALRVPGIASVTAVEPNDGTVLVFCGDVGYNLSSSLQSGVQVELENWRAFGIPAIVRPYTLVTVSISAVVYMQRGLSNYDVTTMQSTAVAAVKAYFAQRKRPDEFFGSAIASALSTTSDEVQQVLLVSVSTSSSPAPDATGSVKRVADTAYGALTSMVRYVVTSTSVQVTIAPPATQ